MVPWAFVVSTSVGAAEPEPLPPPPPTAQFVHVDVDLLARAKRRSRRGLVALGVAGAMIPLAPQAALLGGLVGMVADPHGEGYDIGVSVGFAASGAVFVGGIVTAVIVGPLAERDAFETGALKRRRLGLVPLLLSLGGAGLMAAAIPTDNPSLFGVGMLTSAAGITTSVVQVIRTHAAADPRFAVAPTPQGIVFQARL